MNDHTKPSGRSDVEPEILDRYVDAIQAGDAREESRLLAACPELAEWKTCLQGLDALASTISPDEQLSPTGHAAGTVFGPFLLRDEIGRGGMGIVYRAWHDGLDREVAVKLLATGSFATSEQRRRFLGEARLAARVRHPGIVTIHDAGERDGQLYIAMDLVAGDDLAARLRDGPMAPREAAAVSAEIARAVHHLHASGIVHRDLKPSNVLLDPAGRPLLADFWLARDESTEDHATASGTILGTPEYMPPEQAAGRVRNLGPPADVYGIGALLYAILTGRPPFIGDTKLLVVMNVLEREPVPPRRLNPRVPAALQRICLRCIEKEPSRRYASAAAIADDLEAWLRGDRIAAPGGDLLHTLGRVLRRYPAASFRVAGVLGTLMVVAARISGDPTTVMFYGPVAIGLVLWAGCAVLWEWLGIRRMPPRWTGVLFVISDAVFVTTLLVLVDGVETPLVAVHPVLIAAAGLWLDRTVVRVATVASLAGYVTLLASSPDGFRWNVAAIIAVLILCAGAITDFQAGRLRRG